MAVVKAKFALDKYFSPKYKNNLSNKGFLGYLNKRLISIAQIERRRLLLHQRENSIRFNFWEVFRHFFHLKNGEKPNLTRIHANLNKRLFNIGKA